MVKIRNLFGDRYKGRQGDAVYQGRYGKQIRRTWNDRKKNRSPAQEEQKARFRQAHAWVRTLSTEEIEGLKRFTAEHYPSLTWQQYAIKTALDRGRVSVTTHEHVETQEVYKSDWDLEGWDYRQEITLTNNNSTDLTDFQVKLTLDDTKVGPHFRWDLGGADLRFFDSNGTKLTYYVETWDEANRTATVWVKVTLIPAGGSTTIKMYYGNEQAVSESDANAVFEFFDDFETWEGWIQHGDGQVSQSAAYVKHGSYSLKKSSNGDPNGGCKAIGKTLGRNIVLECWILRESNSGSNADRVGVIDDNGNGYGLYKVDKNKYIGIDKRTNYTGTTYNKKSATTTNKKWYFTQLILTDTQVIAQYVDDSGTLKRTSLDDTDYTQFTRVYVFGGYPYYVDYMRIRKHAKQEPVETWGNETYGRITKQVTVVTTTVTVSHSGLEAVEVYDNQGNLLTREDGLSNVAEGKITQMHAVRFTLSEPQPIGRVVYWSISGVRNEWTAGGT